MMAALGLQGLLSLHYDNLLQSYNTNFLYYNNIQTKMHFNALTYSIVSISLKQIALVKIIEFNIPYIVIGERYTRKL